MEDELPPPDAADEDPDAEAEHQNMVVVGPPPSEVKPPLELKKSSNSKRAREDDDEGPSSKRVHGSSYFCVLSEEEEEEMRKRGQYPANGLEETVCTAELKVNIDSPRRADIYNPRGGRISTLNSQKLPVLQWLRLSAEKGVLYRNAILAPHWNVNAHSIIYITRGNGRFQVVGHAGKSVFDGEVREGQMIIVPQNYVVLKRASEDEGLEWISFKTNDNAVTNQLAGRLSALRGMPEEVLMNSYGISRQDAKRLKYGREETRVFSAASRSHSPRPREFELAMDVIKSVM